MGWSHIAAWIPVLTVNIVCISSERIVNEQSTWSTAANGNAYEEARVICVWYNTIVLGISSVIGTINTAVLYYFYDKEGIVRSRWTVNQLEMALEEENEEV